MTTRKEGNRRELGRRYLSIEKTWVGLPRIPPVHRTWWRFRTYSVTRPIRFWVGFQVLRRTRGTWFSSLFPYTWPRMTEEVGVVGSSYDLFHRSDRDFRLTEQSSYKPSVSFHALSGSQRFLIFSSPKQRTDYRSTFRKNLLSVLRHLVHVTSG